VPLIGLWSGPDLTFKTRDRENRDRSTIKCRPIIIGSGGGSGPKSKNLIMRHLHTLSIFKMFMFEFFLILFKKCHRFFQLTSPREKNVFQEIFRVWKKNDESQFPSWFMKNKVIIITKKYYKNYYYKNNNYNSTILWP